MLALTAELLDSTYRADPDGSKETDHPRAEWPPAPARVLAALVAGGNGERGPGWEQLQQLYAAAHPIIYASPEWREQVLVPTYGTTQQSDKGEVQGYPGRTAALVRRGVRVSVPDPRIVFCWPDQKMSAAGVEGLAHRAARVGYLGCADSQVTLTVSSDVSPDSIPDSKAWVPIGELVGPDPATLGCALVNVGTAEHLQQLMHAFTLADERARSSAQHRGQPRCWYRPPWEMPARDSGGRAVWLEFERPVPGRSVARASHAFKGALAQQYAADWGGEVPDWLHGHVVRGEGEYQLARYLMLPDCGHRHASGRIYGACVWVPASADYESYRMTADSAARLGSFWIEGHGRISVHVADPREKCRWSANPKRWVGPSKRWVTVFPAQNDHHGHMSPAALARWCRRAGLPDPVPDSIAFARGPMIPGAADLSPVETRRPSHQVTRPYSHAIFSFDEPVLGPVAVGGARSYGLGLCAPLPDKKEDE